MSIPISKHYTTPAGLTLRWCGSVLSPDVWPAVNQAAEVLTVAKQEATETLFSAQRQAKELIDIAQERASRYVTEACMAAQREVWSSVLSVWLDFSEQVRSQEVEAATIGLQAVKLVVDRLRLEATVEEQLLSSVSLVLAQQIKTTAGELRVCQEDASILQAALTRLGRTDISIVSDKTLPHGACALRCGEIIFETNFNDNVQMVLYALTQIMSPKENFSK